jgi:hypothetical protein
MKKLFTLAAAFSLAFGASAQIALQKVDQSLANDYAAGCEIDIDNDGLQELIVGGSPNWADQGQTIVDKEGNEIFIPSRAAWVLKWNGTDYEKKQFSQDGTFGVRSHCIPADFNGDGNIDLYIASGGDANTLNGVYLNDGNGNFYPDPNFKVLNPDGTEFSVTETTDDGEVTFNVWYPRAADVADFNNDGLPDIVTLGWWWNSDSKNAMAAVLINNGDGTFTKTAEEVFANDDDVVMSMALCTVKAYDINNDGYPDILFQGNIDNPEGVGNVPTANGDMVNRTFRIYQNLGADTDLSEGPVAFYSLGIETGESHTFGNGNIVVADFNCDGQPDIFVTGESPNDAVTGWSYYGQLLTSKIIMGEVTYTDNTSFVARGKDIRPLNSNNVGVRAIDYTGNGEYELFLDGWSPGMLDGTGATQAGWMLKGQNLTAYERIPGASEQGIFFLDHGTTGAKNYTFTGFHNDGTYFTGSPEEAVDHFDDTSYFAAGRSMVFCNNPYGVAARPDAPQNLNVSVNGKDLEITWDAPANAKNNETYELFLQDENGKFLNSVCSFVGGDKDGIRKVTRQGNAYMNKAINLKNVADGTYTVGVQTINAALRGSTFTTVGNVVVGTGNGIENIATEKAADNAIYNVAGQRVGKSYKGIAIKKGRKVIM